MALNLGQPRVRFAEHFNPGDLAGMAFVPKIVNIRKVVTGTEAENIWAAPAGVFIKQVLAICVVPLDGAPTVTLGTDGDTDALINETDFDVSTAGNWATNIGSATAAGAAGLYLHAGDNIAVEIGGTTVTEGEVRFTIEYLETADMFSRGYHVDL